MTESDNLVNELKKQKPDLTTEAIQMAVKKKMETVGSGYLTEQGAIHLVAADYKLDLHQVSQVTIGTLLVGSKQITLDARLISSSLPKEFERKDGTKFTLRSMVVYDNTGIASVKIWEESIPLDESSLIPGALLRLTNAFVKKDFDDTNSLHIGTGGVVEILKQDSDIVSIESKIVDISSIKAETAHVIISGIADGISTMNYTNSKTGKPSTALRLRLRGSDGVSMRAVLWGKDETMIPKVISPDNKAILYDVRVKMGNQNALEIHGNDATRIVISGKSSVDDMTLRLLSISKGRNGALLSLAIDEKKKLFTITDTSAKMSTFAINDVITCIPSTMRGNRLTVDSDSYIGKSDANLPNISDVRTRIDDLVLDNDYCIEAIVLKINDTREIQTRAGDSIQLSEMLVEDDTGQIWVKGWRDQSKLIGDIALGSVISILGGTVRPGLEGKKDFVLNAFSAITIKN